MQTLSGGSLKRWVGSIALMCLSACASTPRQGAQSAQATLQPELTVDVLVVSRRNDQYEGALAPTLVSVMPNQTERLRVGIFEGAALQNSELWRASVWIAAFQAALALDRPLWDWTIWVESLLDGRSLDGASAGALLTATMLAGMTGANPDAQASFTGTVNPDGSVGPVTGIPEKFRAALEGGKSRLAFPLGQRFAEDSQSGNKPLDLMSFVSSEPRVVVQEVSDIESAYTFLTGQKLPAEEALGVEAMALPEHTLESLQVRTRMWLSSIASTYQEYQRLELKLEILESLWRDIDAKFGVANSLLKQGHIAAAYVQAYTLFVKAEETLLYTQITNAIARERWKEAMAMLDRAAVFAHQRLAEITTTLAGQQPNTVNELMSVATAYEAAARGVHHFIKALHSWEEAKPRAKMLAAALEAEAAPPEGEPSFERQFLGLLLGPVEDFTAAKTHSLVALHNLELRAPALEESASRPLVKEQVSKVGQLFRIAANANVAYFEESFLALIAEHKSVSLDQIRTTFPDVIYQQLRRENRSFNDSVVVELVGNSQASDLVQLAGSLSTYVEAASLIAQYHSLEVEFKGHEPIKLGKRDAILVQLLQQAERKARLHAARAQGHTGEVPLAARIAYQVGLSWQKSSVLRLRLGALTQFWRASVLCQMASLLGRAEAPSQP